MAQLLSQGVLREGGTWEEWDADLREHYSAQLAQHKSEDGVDAIKEGALLKRAQREEIEIKLAQLRNELWPIKAIAELLHQENTNAKNRWLSLPSTYKSNFPDLTPRHIDGLDNLVRETLTEQAHADKLPPNIRRMVLEYYQELHAAAEADCKPVGGSISPPKPRKQRRARQVEDVEDALPAENNGRGE